MVTLERCLREAKLADDLAQVISLDTHRARMLQIASEWRRQAELIRNSSAEARSPRAIYAVGPMSVRPNELPAA